MIKRSFAAVTCIAALAAGIATSATRSHAEPAASQPAAATAFPLTECVISGDKLGEHGPVVTATIEGRTVQFCCGGCVEEFKADVAAGNKKLDDAIIAKQKPTYVLKTCPVTDEPLGSMGDPVMYVDHGSNRLIQLCCKGCLKTVKKDPAAALAKIDAAQAAAK